MAQSDVWISMVALDEVESWPRNPKLHDERGLDESLERFGFTVPLVVDEGTGRLVAGHGRLAALLRRRQAGKPPPARVEVRGNRWLVPVLRGVTFTSAAEAEAYLLADNRLTEQGGWDDAQLLAVVKDLTESGAGLAGTGFAPDYAQRLADSYEMVPVMGEAAVLAARAAGRDVACPNCGANVHIKGTVPGSRVRKASS